MTFLVRMNFLSGSDSGNPHRPQARAVHTAGPNPPKSIISMVFIGFQQVSKVWQLGRASKSFQKHRNPSKFFQISQKALEISQNFSKFSKISLGQPKTPARTRPSTRKSPGMAKPVKKSIFWGNEKHLGWGVWSSLIPKTTIFFRFRELSSFE